MAILTPIILLAQNASSTINENLQVSEENLKNANQELDLLKEQYNNMLTQVPENTFFNFGNMYFWFVLVGLLLLAFGLLFLLAELQNKDRSKKSKVQSIKEEEVEENVEDDEEDIAEEEPELAKDSEEEKIEEELVEEDDDEEDEVEDEQAVKKT
ncbi:MAG: hypothetical protein QG642_304, partial [Patescibacteria group bacterium]|nr:hypothetical protein [Patescibacteria group bacterium]